MSVCLYIFACICISVSLCLSLSPYLFLCVYASPFCQLPLSVSLSPSLCLSLSVCLSVCLSISLPLGLYDYLRLCNFFFASVGLCVLPYLFICLFAALSVLSFFLPVCCYGCCYSWIMSIVGGDAGSLQTKATDRQKNAGEGHTHTKTDKQTDRNKV